MSATPTAAQALDAFAAKVNERLDTIEKKVDEVARPVYERGRTPGHVFATTGPVGRDSAGYSILRAVAYAMGYLREDQAKEEIDVHNKLQALYKREGFVPEYGRRSFLIPFGVDHIPQHEPEGQKLAAEIREKMSCHAGRFDPDEAHWINGKMGGAYTKALGTLTDTAGGVLVGFPTLGELIDLQRNLEVFPRAGASEISLPPNGRIQWPKLTGGGTSYWVGESTAVTESAEKTGYLDLVAKKLGILVKLNNELLKFNSVSAEGMIRLDMARVNALAADLAMLEGTGGTQPLGLLNYPTATAWTPGTDKVILHTASTAGAAGDTFQPEDVALMEGKLPDAVAEPTAWLMRKNFFSVLLNRRADAAVGGDSKGPFMFWIDRGEAGKKAPMELWGTPVVRSSQISSGRVKGGSGATLTYTVLGYFPDWIIGRAGVMEFLATNLGDTAFANDQTWLRGIQYIDAGARHPASFVLCDSLLVA